jgi:hypothetical protein
LFYTEYRQEDGHPDFVYWRKTFEALDIEEKRRNELIKQAMDRMMYPEKYVTIAPVDPEADRKQRIDMFVREESELKEQTEKPMAVTPEKKQTGKPKVSKNTITYGNKYGHHYIVPEEIYSVEPFRERLNSASTLAEVENIIRSYRTQALYRPMNDVEVSSEEETDTNRQKSGKKKHWWQ